MTEMNSELENARGQLQVTKAAAIANNHESHHTSQGSMVGSAYGRKRRAVCCVRPFEVAFGELSRVQGIRLGTA